jgi:hypothetical protein
VALAAPRSVRPRAWLSPFHLSLSLSLSLSRARSLSLSLALTSRWWQGENILTGASGIFPASFTDGVPPDAEEDGAAVLLSVVCVDAFEPGDDPEEIALVVGDELEVTAREWAGSADWWIGTNLRSGQSGAFPSSFVEEPSDF